jgi:hypothetical protein
VTDIPSIEITLEEKDKKVKQIKENLIQRCIDELKETYAKTSTT